MLTAGCRVQALEAGLWQRADGSFVYVARMHPVHLINAYLGALAAGEPAGITEPLGRAVITRGLVEAAWQEAQKRTSVLRKRASEEAKGKRRSKKRARTRVARRSQ